MGLFGCCGSSEEEQALKQREEDVSKREKAVGQKESELFEKQKKFEQEKRQFETDKKLGQVNPTFTSDEDSAKKKKQDKELAELRELNAQQAKELTAKNREIEQLKVKTSQLQRELDALRKHPKTTNGSGGAEEGNFDRSGKRHAQVEEAKPVNVQLVKTEKSTETATLLRNALKECDLLRRLESHHIEAIVEVMKKRNYEVGDFVIKEGDDASEVFVVETGEVEVSHDDDDGTRQRIKKMEAPSTFGEIALLFNTARTANVIATTKAVIWSIDRTEFTAIMQNTNETNYIERSTFLRRVPILKHLSDYEVAKIAHVAERETYESGQFIIREKTVGDTFYIIVRGQCDVYQVQKDNTQKLINKMKPGEHFGEKALLNDNDLRTASVRAASEVQCLVLTRADVIRLIGNLQDIYPNRPAEAQLSVPSGVNDQDPDISLANLAVMSILGEGGFGKVELVKVRKQNRFYARKRVAKTKINKKDMQLEKQIMQQQECKFIVKLYYTLSDQYYVYLLMEPCLGGELWTHLKKHKKFPEERAQFYVACTIEAIHFLHKRKIVYRDIKPENLLLDRHGYAKLADFGLARITQAGSRRWTCCGTPEYMAPEVLLKYGHDFSVDYWAIGVLIYELTQGEPPFKSPKYIMKGIDVATFPSKVSKYGKEIIKNLVQVNPSKRLGNFKNGIDDIKNHRWFQAFDWPGLVQRTITAPWEPTLRSDWDTKYFDQNDSNRITGV